MESVQPMGLDLTLLPFDADHETISYSFTTLWCERKRELFDKLLELPAIKVPDHFRSFLCRDDAFEETHYGITTTTPYGDPLTFVEVEALLEYRNHPGVQDNYLNNAVWSYLVCLPARMKVALFWH